MVLAYQMFMDELGEKEDLFREIEMGNLVFYYKMTFPNCNESFYSYFFNFSFSSFLLVWVAIWVVMQYILFIVIETTIWMFFMD